MLDLNSGSPTKHNQICEADFFLHYFYSVLEISLLSKKNVQASKLTSHLFVHLLDFRSALRLQTKQDTHTQQNRSTLDLNLHCMWIENKLPFSIRPIKK